ncbi:MAG: hypothetical protein NVS4B3_06330 [Gemmatimonadaceae bacterium]
MQRTIVPPQERKRYMQRMAEKKAYYASRSCRFWVFEEAALPGAFLEFYESATAAALADAHAAAREPVLDPARVYREVELD